MNLYSCIPVRYLVGLNDVHEIVSDWAYFFFLPWLLRRGSQPQGEVTLFSCTSLACSTWREMFPFTLMWLTLGWTALVLACLTLLGSYISFWLCLEWSGQCLVYFYFRLGMEKDLCHDEQNLLHSRRDLHQSLLSVLYCLCSGEILWNSILTLNS